MTKKEKAEIKENVIATNIALVTLCYWVDNSPESEEKDLLVEAFDDFCRTYRKLKERLE
jgi:hypothetical protein